MVGLGSASGGVVSTEVGVTSTEMGVVIVTGPGGTNDIIQPQLLIALTLFENRSFYNL